jgi:ABC-type uncharacterized transport system permease subunit/ABC-type branched-subunit amino acid transport system ATPase component
MFDAGEGHIPEDRQRRGLVLEFSLAENIALHDYRHEPYSRHGWLYPARMVERAGKLLKEFDVRGGGPQTPGGALSGGNQQKVVLAREISGEPKVLIAAQPTRGLDVGAIEFVHRRLVEERDEGKAVLLVSLELEEILSLSDRILVIYEGTIVGEYGPDATEEQLGIAMTGGGEGQYLVGSYFAVWIGSSLHGLSGPLHILVAIVAAALAGGAWAGIAGFLKATVGAHEVITTIMLNWIAYWVGSWLFGLGGPLQSSTNTSSPVSNDITDNAHLHVFWGDPVLQGLHIGFFIAIGALVAFWIILNRTTLGFEVRAVGYNPDAARYGGISVARNYFLAMAISGTFAGLAGAMDILGWEFRLNTNDIQASTIGFIAIAVALLGRNTAVGVFFSALLFGALVTGTSTRQLDPTVFPPELASNLTSIIQGLVVLFVGADVLILYLWQARKRVGGRLRPTKESPL